MNLKNIKFIFAIFCVFIVISSCSKASKEKEYFINAYRDCYIARIKYIDSNRANDEVLRILRKYGFTKKTFLEYKEKYSKDPKEFKAILDSAEVRVKRDLLKMKHYE